MHHPTGKIAHTTAFVTPVVEHWLERETAQWVHPMKDRSDDPSHHERTLLPRSYWKFSALIEILETDKRCKKIDFLSHTCCNCNLQYYKLPLLFSLCPSKVNQSGRIFPGQFIYPLNIMYGTKHVYQLLRHYLHVHTI